MIRQIVLIVPAAPCCDATWMLDVFAVQSGTSDADVVDWAGKAALVLGVVAAAGADELELSGTGPACFAPPPHPPSATATTKIGARYRMGTIFAVGRHDPPSAS